LVVAIDDQESSVKLVETVRENFPKLKIVARARNVGHWQKLRSLGVEIVERETFEAAVSIGRHALEVLGVRPYEAKERADVFRRHNVRAMEAILPHWQDIEARTKMAISSRDQLERQMENDRRTADHHGVRGWHTDPPPPKKLWPKPNKKPKKPPRTAPKPTPPRPSKAPSRKGESRRRAIEQRSTGRREGGKRENWGSRASRHEQATRADLLLASRGIFLVLVLQKQKCVSLPCRPFPPSRLPVFSIARLGPKTARKFLRVGLRVGSPWARWDFYKTQILAQGGGSRYSGSQCEACADGLESARRWASSWRSCR
jgi:hypothetical protein